MAEPLLDGIAQTVMDRSQPIIRPGNTNCGGCGMSTSFQFFRRAVGRRDIQMVIPACCAIVAAGTFPTSAYGVPVVASTFASAAAVGTGLAQVARLNGEETRVVCWAGDGGTYDIGFATISAAAERDEDLLFVCYDNKIYGNTGGQRSSATPRGASTTNVSKGKEEEKKDIFAIMAAHNIPYVASISLAHPDDAVRKMRRALDIRGFRFLHILSPCPTGWKSEPALGIELVRLAVRSGLYPILEQGEEGKLTINVEPDFSAEALELYLSLQRRFSKSGITATDLTPAIEAHWRQIRARATEPGRQRE